MKEYMRLLTERSKGEITCTAEEQAGEGAKKCPTCKRNTIHVRTGDCMTPKCNGNKEQHSVPEAESGGEVYEGCVRCSGCGEIVSKTSASLTADGYPVCVFCRGY